MDLKKLYYECVAQGCELDYLPWLELQVCELIGLAGDVARERDMFRDAAETNHEHYLRSVSALDDEMQAVVSIREQYMDLCGLVQLIRVNMDAGRYAVVRELLGRVR